MNNPTNKMIVKKKVAGAVFCMAAVIATNALHAQDTAKKRTIEITSSFKPSLKTQQKINFTASPAVGDTLRQVTGYSIPSQNLSFAFYPAPLKPLAYTQDSAATADNPSAYLKAGYGNFKTPFFEGLASFGDGEKYNANMEAGYVGSKGNLPYQHYSQYGAKGNLWLHMKENNSLHILAGYKGFNTYRYGYEPKDLALPEDSLAVKYNLVSVGIGLSNPMNGPADVSYNGSLKLDYFTDNNSGQETSFHFNVPVEKKISDHASLTVGIKGMVSSFHGPLADFSNNLFLLPVTANLQLKENLTLKAGIIPSWNNKTFKLMPDVEVEYLLNEKNMVLQGGFTGYYTEQNYHSLAAYNPWIAQPDSLTNTRNSDFYVGLKSNVNQNLSYRIKAGFGKQYNIPLFLNDAKDGRYFLLLNESEWNRVFMAGELTYQKGEKVNWTNSLTFNGYGQQKTYDKSYGILPFELRSSLRLLIRKDLRFKADVYTFNGAMYRPMGGGNKRGESALDMNAGLEFDIQPKLRLWLQFNNIINQDYNRWNQYPVLGFQALGGIIFHM